MILFLDDDTTRTKKFKSHCPSAKCVSTSQECIDELSQKWDTVFLDHDLGGEVYVDTNREDCGMEVVRYIVKNKPEIFQIIVHSLNQIAAKEMVLRLQDAGYRVQWVPFTTLFNRIKFK